MCEADTGFRARVQERDSESDFFQMEGSDGNGEDGGKEEGVLADDITPGNRANKKPRKVKKTKKNEQELKHEAELALLTIDENLDGVTRKDRLDIANTTARKMKGRKHKVTRSPWLCSASLRLMSILDGSLNGME